MEKLKLHLPSIKNESKPELYFISASILIAGLLWWAHLRNPTSSQPPPTLRPLPTLESLTPIPPNSDTTSEYPDFNTAILTAKAKPKGPTSTPIRFNEDILEAIKQSQKSLLPGAGGKRQITFTETPTPQP